MLSLGPFPIDHVLSQLNHYGGELAFNGYRISIDESQHWNSVENSPSLTAAFPLKIDVEKIEEELLIPYAAAFQVILADRLDPVSANADGPEATLARITSNKKLKTKGILILAVFFVILLVNFIVFSSLFSANEALAVRVSRTVQTTSDVGKLKEDIQAKTALLAELGWERGINKSLLIDQLASLLPREVTLKEISIDPVDEDAMGHGNQKIRFKDREIRISGNASLVTTVNEWMARVKTRPWVKTVQLQNYNFNSEQNIGQFVVRINY